MPQPEEWSRRGGFSLDLVCLLDLWCPALRTRADSSSRDALLASISSRVQAAAAIRAVTLRAALNKSSQALQGCTAAAMRVLLLLATAWALAPISTPPKRTEFREGIGGATKEQAVAVGETVACAKQPIGPRDVVIRCYDISSDGKLLCGNQPVRRWRWRMTRRFTQVS